MKKERSFRQMILGVITVTVLAATCNAAEKECTSSKCDQYDTCTIYIGGQPSQYTGHCTYVGSACDCHGG